MIKVNTPRLKAVEYSLAFIGISINVIKIINRWIHLDIFSIGEGIVVNGMYISYMKDPERIMSFVLPIPDQDDLYTPTRLGYRHLYSRDLAG